MIPSERYKYRVEIQQMMFVAGATSDPPAETVALVEDIVRAQVVEIIAQGTSLARRRGAKTISVEDVMFLIRHDPAKVNRLSSYLSWKDVRKNTRDEGGGAEGTDLLDDPGVVSNTENSKKMGRKQKMVLPWKLPAMFNISLPDDDDADDSDEEDDESSAMMLERLKKADMRTRNMTKEEYVHWSECRQASFTYRKSKRFKDWVGVAHLTDYRLQDDITDILGFLTFEIVANLTEVALVVKDAETLPAKPGTASQNKQKTSLFDKPNSQDTPILARHIREAFRRYEQPTAHNLALRTYTRGSTRYNARLI